MKRLVLLLPIVLILTGCAQLFDLNLYGSFDKPPPLNAGQLRSASVNDIQKLMEDPSFLESLKSDDAALDAVQDALNDAITNATTNEAKLEAAATLITLSADASAVSETKTNALQNISSIQDALDANNWGLALKIFLGNQDEAQITKTLNTLVTMASTLTVMQTVASGGVGTNTVDATVFFSGVPSGDVPGFAQTALMSALVNAMVADMGSVAATAAELAKASPVISNGGNDMTKFTNAWSSTRTVTAATASPGSGYSYAYLSAVKSKVTF